MLWFGTVSQSCVYILHLSLAWYPQSESLKCGKKGVFQKNMHSIVYVRKRTKKQMDTFGQNICCWNCPCSDSEQNKMPVLFRVLCVWDKSSVERGNENACWAHNVFIPHYVPAIQYSWPGLGKRPWYVAHHEYTTTEWLSHKTHCNPEAPCWLWYPDCEPIFFFYYLVQSIELN